MLSWKRIGKSWCLRNTSGPIVSTTILQELTHFHTDQVLDKCDKLKTLKYVHTAREMWRKEHGRAIVNAVNEGFANVAISELKSFGHDKDEADVDIIDQE